MLANCSSNSEALATRAWNLGLPLQTKESIAPTRHIHGIASSVASSKSSSPRLLTRPLNVLVSTTCQKTRGATAETRPRILRQRGSSFRSVAVQPRITMMLKDGTPAHMTINAARRNVSGTLATRTSDDCRTGRYAQGQYFFFVGLGLRVLAYS